MSAGGPAMVGPLVMLSTTVRTLTTEIVALSADIRQLRSAVERLGARVAILTLEGGPDRHRSLQSLDAEIANEITQKIHDSLRRETP